jgi:hypothetical protein
LFIVTGAPRPPPFSLLPGPLGNLILPAARPAGCFPGRTGPAGRYSQFSGAPPHTGGRNSGQKAQKFVGGGPYGGHMSQNLHWNTEFLRFYKNHYIIGLVSERAGLRTLEKFSRRDRDRDCAKFESSRRFRGSNMNSKKVASLPSLGLDSGPRFSDLSFHSQPCLGTKCSISSVTIF